MINDESETYYPKSNNSNSPSQQQQQVTPLKQQSHSQSSSPSPSSSSTVPNNNTSPQPTSTSIPPIIYDTTTTTNNEIPPPSSSSSYTNHNSSYKYNNNSFYRNSNNNNNNNYRYNNNNHSSVLLVHGFDPHFVTIQMLHTLFNNAGLVKCIKIHHIKEGYAFVQMSDPEEAEFAKLHFNLLDIDGKTLNVNYSKYNYIEGSEDKPQYFQSYHLNNFTKRYPPSEPSLQLWCTSWTNPPPDQNQLLQQFGKYGEITNIKITNHNDKYYVFVRYAHLAHATKAMLCLTGQSVCNSLHLRIMYSRSTVHH